MTSMEEALSYHKAGRLEEAEAAYDRILATHPEHPDALHLKGVVALQRGDPRTAVQWISRAIVLRPEDAAFFSNLAVALQALGLNERAIEYARRALDLQPDKLEAHHVLAQALKRQGAYEESISAYKTVLAAQPGHRKALDGAVECLGLLGRTEDAIELLSARRSDLDDAQLIVLSGLLRAVARLDDALAALQACAQRDGHDWHANMLKLRLHRKEERLAVTHGQALLLFKDALAHERCAPQSIISAREAWAQSVPNFRPNDAEAPDRNVVCFSLWGNQPKYTYNAVLNAKRVPEIYPGWRARFYVDRSVPVEITQALVDYGASVIAVAEDGREFLKLFWRFLATDDPQVERFLCRDCDAVVNRRERAAVDEWLRSGKRFHVMRDHPEHAELIMAGMWGGVAGLLPRLSDRAVSYYESHEPKWRWIDQDFLRDCVWPVIKDDCLVHDDIYRMGGEVRSFPEGALLPSGEHVGGYRPRFAAESQDPV